MAGLLPAVLDRATQRLSDSFSLVGQDLVQQLTGACNHSNGHSVHKGMDSAAVCYRLDSHPAPACHFLMSGEAPAFVLHKHKAGPMTAAAVTCVQQ